VHGVDHQQLRVVAADGAARIGKAVDQPSLAAGKRQGKVQAIDVHPDVTRGIPDRRADARRVA
jgi:hypothetical protein